MVEDIRLANNLAKLREWGGYSLASLSRVTGITKSHLHSLETGKSKNPTLDVLLKLTDCYNVELSTLLGLNGATKGIHIELVVNQLEAAKLGHLTMAERATLDLALAMAIAKIKQDRL